MNGSHLVEWFNTNGFAVLKDAKHRCSLSACSHQQLGQRRGRHNCAALGVDDRRNQVIHPALHVPNSGSVRPRKYV